MHKAPRRSLAREGLGWGRVMVSTACEASALPRRPLVVTVSVQRAGPQPVPLRRHHVKTLARPGGIHALQVDQVVHGQLAALRLEGGRERTAQLEFSNRELEAFAAFGSTCVNPLPDAPLGTDLRVPTLDSPVTLRVPAGTRSRGGGSGLW